MQDQISRRAFVEIAAACFGAIAVASSGPFLSDAYAVEKPASLASAKPKLPAGSKILIAYASRCGSTAEIAETLGRDLRSRGYQADVRPAASVSALTDYQALLLGSAVRAGNWLPEATGFARKYQQEIRNLPCALFTVHMRNRGDDEKSRNARLAYLNEAHKAVRPDLEVFFAGSLDLTRLSFGERLMCKVMGGAQSQDLRNWPAIHAWGSSVFSPEVRS